MEVFRCFDNADVPIFNNDSSLLVNGDSLELLKYIPSNSISLLLTDPPYHSTKKDNILGDTIFNTDEDFINWMMKYSKEWHRVLKPNGSAFCFCSPKMQSRLEVGFSNYFNILSSITWTKPNKPGYDGWKNKMKKESLRQWYSFSERIIFMSPKYQIDSSKSYFSIKLKEWRNALNVSGHYLTGKTGAYGAVNHGGAVSNWEAGRNIPSLEQYKRIINVLSELDVDDTILFPKYEDIIRPFNVNSDFEFTDVWNFENVRQHKGKHPAEKPIDLLENAISASSYKGDIVLDTFSGSGSTAIAANNLHRKSISIELDNDWFNYSKNRIINNDITLF